MKLVKMKKARGERMKLKNKPDPVLTKICMYIILTVSILYVLYNAG